MEFSHYIYLGIGAGFGRAQSKEPLCTSYVVDRGLLRIGMVMSGYDTETMTVDLFVCNIFKVFHAFYTLKTSLVDFHLCALQPLRKIKLPVPTQLLTPVAVKSRCSGGTPFTIFFSF